MRFYIESGEGRLAVEPPGRAWGKACGPGRPGHLRLEVSFPCTAMSWAPPRRQHHPHLRHPHGPVRRQLLRPEGDYTYRRHLEVQSGAFQRIMNRDFSDMATLPKRIQPIALVGRGAMRAGMPIYRNDEVIGWVTSGTMVPYYRHEGLGLATKILDTTAKRAIGLAYLAQRRLEDDLVEVDIRGKRVQAVIPPYHMRVDAPPFARPIIYKADEEAAAPDTGDRKGKAINLLRRASENHQWRQKCCINLIPRKTAPAAPFSSCAPPIRPSATQSTRRSSPSMTRDIFYYQGTRFIDEVEQMVTEQMKQYLGCAEVETRVTSGQMSNMAVFSALMDWKKPSGPEAHPSAPGLRDEQPHH